LNSLADARYRPVLGEIDPLAAGIDFRSPTVVGMCEVLDRLRDAGRKVAIVGPTSFAPQGYLILGYEAVERGYTNLGEVPNRLVISAVAKSYVWSASATRWGWSLIRTPSTVKSPLKG
jgi:hypothetical protein